MWAEPATTGEGGDYLGDEPDSKMLRRYLRMNMAHPATGFGATEDILDGNNSDLKRPSFHKKRSWID